MPAGPKSVPDHVTVTREALPLSFVPERRLTRGADVVGACRSTTRVTWFEATTGFPARSVIEPPAIWTVNVPSVGTAWSVEKLYDASWPKIRRIDHVAAAGPPIWTSGTSKPITGSL